MTMNPSLRRVRRAVPVLTAVGVIAGLVGCAGTPSPADADRDALQVIRAAFRDEGIARTDRLNQDAANADCSKALGAEPPAEQAKAIEAAALKTVRPPVNGGNCYNCHQLDKKEISFGTIGPSLYNFGKLRGVTDPASEAARPMVEYTWGKLWNARAYNACSHMPRAGHLGILDETQIRHLMALLLDPKSPVNQ